MPQTTVPIARVRDFTRERDFDEPVVRVSNGVLAALGGRGAWVALRCGGRTIHRRVLGSGGAQGMAADMAELDYDARQALAIVERTPEGSFPCAITLQPASLLGRFLAHWHHPSNEYRAPFQIAMIGLVLGVIGLVLGVISLVH